jgi:hypothetical protein
MHLQNMQKNDIFKKHMDDDSINRHCLLKRSKVNSTLLLSRMLMKWVSLGKEEKKRKKKNHKLKDHTQSIVCIITA